MNTDCEQRWREGRNFFVPSRLRFDPAGHEVAALPRDNQVRPFIVAHHYSGSFPSASHRFGLFRRGVLVGVAVFGTAPNQFVLPGVFEADNAHCTVLSRLVLLDEVGFNGESWFVSRCFALLRALTDEDGKRLVRGVLSYSDPVPRTDALGRVLFPGHLGLIYQALSAVHLGRSKARTLRLFPDGTVLIERAITKIKPAHQGWEGACEQLARHGAELTPGLLEEMAQSPQLRAEWLEKWLTRLTRPLKHPGNWKYAWSLDRRVRIKQPALPYPRKG